MASSQVTRLASVKTVERSKPGGVSSTESAATTNSLFSNRILGRPFVPQQAEEDAKVRIEVFAYGALGKEAVLVASLSNSVLLVMHVVGDEGQAEGGSGLRSWLLEWPVAGKIRGLCVSPDLQCVLCVTEALEGVYILAVNNLGAQDEAPPAVAVPSLDDHRSGRDKLYSAPDGGGNSKSSGASSTREGEGEGGVGRSSVAAVAGAKTARPPPRTVAATAFPSLLHLASRGQRKRTGDTFTYPPAEPVFIASLARRGGAGTGEDGGEYSDGRSARRHSTGSGGRASSGGGRGGRRTSQGSAPFECLWWAARNGDHFAVIGGPGGEVHFLDLERLDAWVVTPPPPTMARGRVCALTIVADLAATQPSQSGAGGLGNDSTLPSTADEVDKSATDRERSDPPRHLVAVLETGAVFVVLLEQTRPGRTSDVSGGDGKVDSEASVAGEMKGKVRGNEKSTAGGLNAREHIHLGAGRADQDEFAPSWLDVGRGGGGGGGGSTGVRAMPQPVGLLGGGSADGAGVASDDACRSLRMSVVSRAWGNKCAVKILRVAATPTAAAGGDKERPQGKERERGSGKQRAFRTETVKQITLPVDHPSPENHALAVVDGTWAVLAGLPAGGAPSRVTVAPLGKPERLGASPARVFPLPAGERVAGVALLPSARVDDVDGIPRPGGIAGKAEGEGSWGLVWSDFCIYRIDLGGEVQAPSKTVEMGKDASPHPHTPSPLRQPRLPPTPTPTPTPPQPPAAAPMVGSTASIALRRPSAASVRRARDLHAAGRLAEAAQVAIEALDENLSSAVAEETAGGGVTTRMVREDLANSLLEWLVVLHVRELRGSPRATAPGTSAAEGAVGSAGVGNGVLGPRGETRPNKGLIRPASKGRIAATRRGSKLAPHARSSPRSGSKRETSAHKTAGPVGATSAASPSSLERYLLSSRDYDPVLAATLLHAHGEADLAVVAGTARGDAALRGVLRVLAESAWPPRLGARAVEALCDERTGVAAARELIRVAGGTMFAAVDPGLRLRVLTSHRSILFGSAEGDCPAAMGGLATPPAAKTDSTVKDKDQAIMAEEATAAVSEGGVVAGIVSHLGPTLPALSVEDLNELIHKLARWCEDDVARPSGSPENGAEDLSGHPESLGRSRLETTPSVAVLEAFEILLQALCELGGRDPPPGKQHRRAWLQAGCIDDVYGRESSSRPAQVQVGDSFTGSSSTMGGAEKTTSGDGLLPLSGRDGASGVPPQEWTQLTASLCGILADEGICGGNVYDSDGGLPTAARRSLLRALPVVRGWHDPVRSLMRLRRAGCWAAVALELEFSRNWREAASARLHGVVALLQDEQGGTLSATASIFGGKASPCHQSSSLPRNNARRARGGGTGDADPPGLGVEVESNRVVTSALLRIIDEYAFGRSSVGGEEGYEASNANSATTDADAPATLMAAATPLLAARAAPIAPHVVLTRASVLAEALCVWGYFRLARATLEASLRPRLDDRNDVRVLAAVFFPQLSRDVTRGDALTGDSIGVTAGEVVTGCWREPKLVSTVGDAGASASSGPTTAQTEAASDLGLSPQFLLALTRVAGRLFASSAPSAPGWTTEDAASRSSWRRPEFARGKDAMTAHSVAGSRPSFPSSLALLLEHHHAEGGAAASSAPVTPAPATAREGVKSSSRGRNAMSGIGVAVAGEGGWLPPAALGQAAIWSGAVTEGRVPPADDKNMDEVWFSCGHRYSREHLLGTVVPTCLSSLRHATSSLQRTEQVLALEYEGRNAGAACPECAARELRRLVAGIRPDAAAARGTERGTAIPPPPAPPLPSPPRLPTYGRTSVR